MKVEKIISNVMKKVDPGSLSADEVEEIEDIKKYEMTDSELSRKLSKILVKEINRE